MATTAAMKLAIAPLLVLLVSCHRPPRAPDQGGVPWVRVTNANFIVETDLGADDAAKVLRELNQWRAAMTVAVFHGARAPAQHLHVVVLRNGELQALNGDFRGFFSDRPDVGAYLVLGASETSQRSDIMKHELAHAVIADNLPRAPQWLNEGLAAYLETTELDEKSGAVTWGALPYLASYEHWHELAASNEVLDPRPWSPWMVGWRTHSARFMVHMLVRTHRAAFECLLGRLNEREEYLPAREHCFGTNTDWGFEYAHELSERGGKALGSGRVELEDVVPRLEPMNDADIHAVIALVDRVMSELAEPKSDSERELLSLYDLHRERALALNPTQVLAASLELASRARVGKDQSDLTARLVRDNPDDWRAWIWRSRVLLSTGPQAETSHAINRLSSLAPHRQEVVEMRALEALISARWEEAATLAHEALAWRPRSTVARIALVLALERLGRCDQVRTALGDDDQTTAQMRTELRNWDFPRPTRCTEW